MLMNFAVYLKFFLICYFLFELETSFNFAPKRAWYYGWNRSIFK